MQAYLKNYRQAPRKVRLIANAVRGKNVKQALEELSLMPQRASEMFSKLIKSAVANAQQKDSGATEETLFIETITADKGITYTRYRPRAFGRAAPIHRECAHVRVTLGSTAPVAEAAPVKAASDKKEEKTTAKKTEEPVAKETKEKATTT